jgi:two-component system, NarL family, sensor histidine kinase UhpB
MRRENENGPLAAWSAESRDRPRRSARPRRHDDLLLGEMAENVHDVLWVAAPESRRIRYVNRAYERVWGRSRPGIGDDAPAWPEAVHPEDRPRIEAALADDGLSRPYDEVYRIVRPDETVRWIWDRAVVVRDAAGRVRHLAGIAADITGRKEAEDALRRSHAQLRALSERRETVREEERTRVAREIHDELGQVLTTLKLDLAWLADRPPAGPRALRARLRTLSRRIDGALRAVRTIATALRPAPLDHLGLVAAIEWQARQFQALAGVRVLLDLSLHDPDLDPGLSTAVFRIFQEALTNVARHANASHVAVRLAGEDGSLRLDVADDGRGIRESERDALGSLGLLGMRERARSFSGELDVRPRPEGGTAVTLRLPIRLREGTP